VRDADAARLVAVLEHGESPAFPFAHEVRMETAVAGGTLRVSTTVAARDARVPVAFGFHPYLLLPGVAREQFRLELPVRRRLVLDDRKVPSGRTEPVEPFVGPLGSLEFDDGYDELAQPPVFALQGGGRRLELAFEHGFPYAQVFAPPGKDLISFEPMTAPADALRTGAFAVATPEEPYTATFVLSVG
jgi:galactose mutarotase-like enzyme